jgi:hypothetical protein
VHTLLVLQVAQFGPQVEQVPPLFIEMPFWHVQVLWLKMMLEALQDKHWFEDPPEHVAQEKWQVTHCEVLGSL